MANTAVEDVVAVVAQIGRDANICSRSSSMLAGLCRPEPWASAEATATALHNHHSSSTPTVSSASQLPTPLILQLNPSRKLGMFSVGDGAPSEKRKARYCVGPGAAAYDWKCPSRARSEAPPAHYVVHCGAVWCCVVLYGAVWCCMVPEPTLLCRRLPPSMPLCVQWNLQAFCRN